MNTPILMPTTPFTLVLGQPRGGTSAVAGLLSIMGVNMFPTGEQSRRPSTTEDVALRLQQPDKLIKLLEELVPEQTGPWGMKDPTLLDRLSYRFHFLHDLAEAIGPYNLVVVTRDPWAVAMTEQAASQSGITTINYWLAVTTERFGKVAEVIRKAGQIDAITLTVVSYEHLIRDPLATAESLTHTVPDTDRGSWENHQALDFINPSRGYACARCRRSTCQCEGARP